MSNRTSRANKAVEKAWELERERILRGEGTRNWTAEQQRDILETGKAHDTDGRAFQGHHMKSVEAYPEYQDNPYNIQFLSQSEHYNAHGGSWQNSTNGFYDVEAEVTMRFGDKEFIPIQTFKLSESVATQDNHLINDVPKQPINETVNSKKKDTVAGATQPKPPTKPKKSLQLYDKLVNFYIAHSETIKVVYRVVHRAVGAALRYSYSEDNNNSSTELIDSLPSSSSLDETEIQIPTPHEEQLVSESFQHYHTKDGVVLKQKAPYFRYKKDK